MKGCVESVVNVINIMMSVLRLDERVYSTLKQCWYHPHQDGIPDDQGHGICNDFPAWAIVDEERNVDYDDDNVIDVCCSSLLQIKGIYLNLILIQHGDYFRVMRPLFKHWQYSQDQRQRKLQKWKWLVLSASPSKLEYLESWSQAPPPLSSIAPRRLLARFAPPLQQPAEFRTRAPSITPWPWLAGPPCLLQLPKTSPVAAGQVGAPPFLVLMLSTASSFIEMLVWMGPRPLSGQSCSPHFLLLHQGYLLPGPLFLTPSVSKEFGGPPIPH